MTLPFLAVLLILTACTTNQRYSGEFPAVYDLVERVLPDHASSFTFETLPAPDDGISAFELSSPADGKILIKATDKSAASRGLYHYIRHYMKGNISHNGTQIPDYAQLPAINEPVTVTTQMPYRYYFNYCTFSYSMAFWTWEEWEKELDWMALQGINLSLAVVGSEAVWQNTLREMGFSEKEIFDFIPGPAYLAWWVMDNLEGWGGPVSQEWIDSRAALQVKILARMRELGIEPVLQSFYGMVPNKLIEKFPNNTIYKDVLWGGLQRPAFLDPRDSLYIKMSSVYYAEQEKLYGKANFYSGDPFHEGGHKSGDLSMAAKIVQSQMQKHSPGSTWILQGWQDNPADELLAGTDKQYTMILDLCGEGQPWYAKRKSFNDRHFLWCNINNFGNNTYMSAVFDSITTVPPRIMRNQYRDNFKGIGLAMEGSLTDPIIPDLFYDVAWSELPIDQEQWLADYAEYRYGNKNENLVQALRLMGKTVYSTANRTENILCARPSLNAQRVTTWAPTANPHYNQDSLVLALKYFVNVNDPNITGTETYRFDLANLARQVTTGMSYAKLQELKALYNKRDMQAFEKTSNEFLDLILAVDSLASQMPNYSFYEWQQKALAAAPVESDKDRFLWNANRLVTLWSNKEGATDLHDYAYREWYGLLANFYYPRWKMYFDYIIKSFNDPQIEPVDFYQWEDEWCNRELTEPEKSEYDIKQIIKRHILQD